MQPEDIGTYYENISLEEENRRLKEEFAVRKANARILADAAGSGLSGIINTHVLKLCPSRRC